MRRFYVGIAGGIDAALSRAALVPIGARLSSEFGAPVADVDLPSIDFAFDPGRGQYASSPVLELLSRMCPPDALKLLAVTGCDLFIPVLTFVYGQAQLGGRVAVVSLARLKQEFYGLPPNHEILQERALKEALHEAGHLFGLVHCVDRNCVMALATNVQQIDAKEAAFCAPCGARIERLTKEQSR
jgi:archaemetzincin